jgi:hypothetical protein
MMPAEVVLFCACVICQHEWGAGNLLLHHSATIAAAKYIEQQHAARRLLIV